MSDGADWWQQQQLLEQEQWEKQERINNGNRHYDSWRIWHRKKHIITQLKSHNLTQLGEHKNVSLEISRQILEMSI